MSRKIFVGSLPPTITEDDLRHELGKYGSVEDVFIKPNCDPTRQWAFVTYRTADEAVYAKESCDRVLIFHGQERPCDVMIAKNQGMFGQNEHGVPNNGMVAPAPATSVVPDTRARKIFVGSLPDDVDDNLLHSEFSRFGHVEDVFVKQGCQPGRQWGFVTFCTPDEAQYAQEQTNGFLVFPGSSKACEVTLARNQGMFGQDKLESALGHPSTQRAAQYQLPLVQDGPRKIFVGSLPDSVDDVALRAEFSKYGQIVDVFLKKVEESGRHWAFVTFGSSEQAINAKAASDRILMFPDSLQPCEVTIAKHQGLYGQDCLESGPKKIFVGSLPDGCDEQLLRQEFKRYGTVVDVFLKQTNESGRHWAFITYSSAIDAKSAKDATDRVLLFPGAEKPCEVMLAKNQGMRGENPLNGGAVATGAVQVPMQAMPFSPSQPPPPAGPTPLTPWRMYKTAAGLPYYHNHATGVTQWECPLELQVPGARPGHAAPARSAVGARYSPY